MTMIDTSKIPEGAGYQPNDIVPAVAFQQAGHRMYDIVVSIPTLVRAVKMPVPGVPEEDNRVVKEPRARLFGIDYVLGNSGVADSKWVCPPMIVRVDPGRLKVSQVVQEWADGTSWVLLEVPRALLWAILDGQHRALGFQIAEVEGPKRVAELDQRIAEANGHGEIPEVVAALSKEREDWADRVNLMNESHVAVTIMEATAKEGRQAFVDIARNAKGITPDFTVVLDERSVVHRIAMDVTVHPLLDGRVESGQSGRMSKKSANLLGAKSVADIVHGVLVGSGRVSKGREADIARDETAYKEKVEQFLDGLVAGFPKTLGEIESGGLTPLKLRETSLLGSSTMLRCLAIVWHNLRGQGISIGDIEKYFKKLEAHMALGSSGKIEEGRQPWMGTGAFIPESTAPQARQGSIKSLSQAMTNWQSDGIPK